MSARISSPRLVWLRCLRVDEQWFRLEVEDTGPGIARDSQARLFREFEPLDITGELGQLGTGLGLAINKRLAEALGGSVSVESTPKKGSVFAAVLPLPSTPAATLPRELEREPESATRLLVAEAHGAETRLDDGKTRCA